DHTALAPLVFRAALADQRGVRLSHHGDRGAPLPRDRRDADPLRRAGHLRVRAHRASRRRASAKADAHGKGLARIPYLVRNSYFVLSTDFGLRAFLFAPGQHAGATLARDAVLS